jgi:competence protein ComFC
MEKVEFSPLPLHLKLEPLYLEEVQAMANYTPPLSSAIQLMKYHPVRGIAHFLGDLLYDTTVFPNVQVITCVPLHFTRYQERGFNQAELIAKTFARRAHLPYLPLLKRKQKTTSQASLGQRSKRLTNLAEIFMVKKVEHRPHTILIIDDVVTTGTTLNECAKKLKEAGVEKVYGLTVAHGL